MHHPAFPKYSGKVLQQHTIEARTLTYPNSGAEGTVDTGFLALYILSV